MGLWMNLAGQIGPEQLHREPDPQLVVIGIRKTLAQSDACHSVARNPRRPNGSSHFDRRHPTPPIELACLDVNTGVAGQSLECARPGGLDHGVIMATRIRPVLLMHSDGPPAPLHRVNRIAAIGP